VVEKRYKLTLPERLSREPIVYHLAHDFEVVMNIRRARFTEKRAWVEITLQGKKRAIKKAIEYLVKAGVKVEELAD
jgi:ABC-type methionine transport system ATPase subunit